MIVCNRRQIIRIRWHICTRQHNSGKLYMASTNTGTAKRRARIVESKIPIQQSAFIVTGDIPEMPPVTTDVVGVSKTVTVLGTPKSFAVSDKAAPPQQPEAAPPQQPAAISYLSVAIVNVVVYIVFCAFAVIFMVSAANNVPMVILVPVFSIYSLTGMFILILNAIYVKYIDIRDRAKPSTAPGN